MEQEVEEQVKGQPGLELGDVGTPINVKETAQEIANVREAVKEVAKEAAKEVVERKAADDIFDGLAREVVSREVAGREGRAQGRSLVVEIPQDGEGGFDLISYGSGEMIGEFDKALDKDRVHHRGIEISADITEDLEKIGKLREMAQRQISAARATERRKALEAKLGVRALPGPEEEKLLTFEGSEKINQGGEQSGTSEPEG